MNAQQRETLRDELYNDPEELQYNLLNANEKTAAINGMTEWRIRDTMTGSEVLQAVDLEELTALSATDQRVVWDVLHLGVLDPAGAEATLLLGAFGQQSNTIAALKQARQEPTSRALELQLGRVRVAHVLEAEAHPPT
jgi:hypothetical protein